MHNNYTLVALSGLFSTKQKTAMDEMPPKWLPIVHKHQPGVSFGPKQDNAIFNQHNARLQDLRKKKKQKRSKFSWKKTNTSASLRLWVHPMDPIPPSKWSTNILPFSQIHPRSVDLSNSPNLRKTTIQACTKINFIFI